MTDERRTVMLAGVQDLLASKTWKPDRDDLNFAVGYVASYVRQCTKVAITEEEGGVILDTLLAVTR